MNSTYENNTSTMYGNSLQNTNIQYDNVDITNLLTSDKKVACFVGTSKNGTSFIVNNLAEYNICKNGNRYSNIRYNQK